MAKAQGKKANREAKAEEMQVKRDMLRAQGFTQRRGIMHSYSTLVTGVRHGR